VLLLVPLLGLALLWPIERRQTYAVVPPELVGRPIYRWLLLAAGLHALPYFGTAQLAPLLVQVGLGLAPAEAGWLLSCYPLGQALSGLVGGRLVDRLGGATVSRLGLAIMLLGLSGLWLATGSDLALPAATALQLALVASASLSSSLGAGLVLIAMSTLALAICGPTRRASGMGLYTMVTYVGEAVGTNLFALALSGRSGAALTAGFALIYLVALGLTALAWLASGRLGRASERSASE
jgi:MFS family permease